jgi:pyruvate/2-oxoglutarate dehydrogenase complex dihydrolipoamide dehydrogenase (E3) component
MRKLRAHIAPVDGHGTSVTAGTHVFQGRGKFTSPSTVQVNGVSLKFKKAVIAAGGRPMIPNIPGLKAAPYTTNEVLFNLEVMPPRMVILGAGVVALEMAQSFATFGSRVTVLQRGKALFESKQGDPDAAKLLREELEKSGVQFLSGSTKHVETLRERTHDPTKLPLMKVTVATGTGEDVALECECLLVATGRVANVEDLGLEAARVEYELGQGVKVNDFAQSVSNPGTFGPGQNQISRTLGCLTLPNSAHSQTFTLSATVSLESRG